MLIPARSSKTEASAASAPGDAALTRPMARPETHTMGRVALTVHDLDRVAAFYEKAVGLHRLSADGETAILGAGDRPLLELRRDPAARRRSPREAGLFHTAFLLPERGDLGRFLRQALMTRTPLVGASDHSVSEALYLSDPEGNGVEVYADRPAATWRRDGDAITMTTEPLDVDDLIAHASGPAWTGVPDATRVGHVHLQVGAIAPAEAFYAGVLGFTITARYPGGSFFATDGYHHHLAANIWNSRGAGVRTYPSTGLAEVEIALDAARIAAATGEAGGQAPAPAVLSDPWGTAIVLKPR